MIGLILSLDIGTSSTRALLYNAENGTVVEGSSFSLSHDPVVTPDGGSTLDADTLVEEAVQCAAAALGHTQGQAVLAVALCTFWHSFVGVDKSGNARTPILLWSDQRSALQVARLQDLLDTKAYVQRTGCPLHTSFTPGRLLWLKETDADAFAESTHFLSPGEYVFSRLLGLEKVTCSRSMASGSGLLNQAMGEWDMETLSVLGIEPARLSPLVEGPVSGLSPDFQNRLPALANVPWFPAIGDGAASNVGCGATTPERLALMVGTSGAMRVVTPGAAPPEVPRGLWRYQIGPERFMLGGALSNGGAVWAWLKRTVRLPNISEDELEEAIAALPPDGHGLTVLPFLSGERAPLWRDDLRATIHGLSAATTPVELARAHLEAVALRFAQIRAALRPVAPSGEIIGTGAGLLASRVWAQIIADALGEPIHLSSEEQASSRGAVLLAREHLGMGAIEDAPLPTLTETVTPNPSNTAIYQAALERQEALLKSLWGE